MFFERSLLTKAAFFDNKYSKNHPFVEIVLSFFTSL